MELRRAVSRWLGDGKAQGWSPRTLSDREGTMERFCWWLEHEARVSPTLDALRPELIREFLAYAREANPQGRFGCPRESAKREARPATVNAAFRILRAFSNFCQEETLLKHDPLKNVKEPRVPKDQVKPLNGEQVQLLLDAARRSVAPERDVAVVLLLVDTGMRVSELIGLTIVDADRQEAALTVTGKGNKRRTVFMGMAARRALWRYLEAERRDALADEPLFISVGGNKSGSGLTTSGAHRIVAKAGKAAKITGVRCSPHTLRHTFAVNFLREGGNVYELQQLMGHEDLTILRRYIALAQADLETAHRKASPADRMKLR